MSKETRLSDHKLVIRTFENGRKLVTEMLLSGPELLDFESKSDDPRIPIIKGRYFSADYEDCVLKATLVEQNLAVFGVVTKLDATHAISLKSLADASSGKIQAIVREHVELITQEELEEATMHY